MSTRRSLGVLTGCLALATMVSACGVSRKDHDADMSALRAEMQAEMARRDTLAFTGLSLAIALNAEQERRLASLESGMAALDDRMGEVEELAVGAIRYNAPVHFAYDSYQEADDTRAALDGNAAVLRPYYAAA